MIKFLGYGLLGLGGALLGISGYGVETWQFWAISCCFIVGNTMARWE